LVFIVIIGAEGGPKSPGPRPTTGEKRFGRARAILASVRE
jgi:hypothetical protein